MPALDRRIDDISWPKWPLGSSLEEAQKSLRELLADMKRCYEDWGQPGGGRYVIVGDEKQTFGSLPKAFFPAGTELFDRKTGKKYRVPVEATPTITDLYTCATPPKDWADLPTQ